MARRNRHAAVAALALVLLAAAPAAFAASTSSTTTTTSNGATNTRSTSASFKGPGEGPAVVSSSSTSNSAGPVEIPPPGGCVVASQSEGQSCADGLCCTVAQELRLCMPSWAKMDGKTAPPPPIPRAFAAVAGGPAVPCCVMLADGKRNGALVPFCAADPLKTNNGAFLPLPSGAVVTKVTPSCAAGAKAPSGFKYGTVACSVAFPLGTLPEGFSAPAGDFTAKAPLIADVSGKAAPCAPGYGRLLQVSSVVPQGKEGPNGEPPGTLRVTSKCE